MFIFTPFEKPTKLHKMTTTEKEILSILKTIQGSGSFEKSGVKEFIPPGLHIKGIGEVSFPLNPIMTKAIIEQAIKAPFGKGSQTVTDTNVRSAWEIDGSQLSFKNKDWKGFLAKIIGEVKEGLGVEEQEVDASLYKLLIYEEGDFFLPHKDSEKEKGMFATLILSLPSEHTGGELMIRFEGKEETIDFSLAASNYKIPYAAFYADCEHEVKPVTSGYRVNLVYNLVQKAGNKIYSPQFSEQVADLTGLIKSMESSFEETPKAILLDHQYTPTNFSLKQLKHHDWPRAQALLAAAEKAGYFAKLGLLTHYIMGDLEEDYSSYRRRGRGRYRDYPNEPADGEGTMGDDIYELYSKIEHWSENSGPTLGEMTLDESDIIRTIELGDGDPIEQEQEGYTGNAGMTIEYWYHYGAVILWPKSKHADLLFNQPIAKRLGWLDYYVQHWEVEALNSKAYTKELLIGLANSPEEEKKWNDRSIDNYSPVSAALIKLDDAAFVRNNFVDLLTNKFEKIEVAHWTTLLAHYPTEIFNAVFQKVGQKEDIKIIKHLLSVLEVLINSPTTKLAKFALYHIQLLPNYLANVPLHVIREKYSSNDVLKDNITTIVEKTIDLSFHNEIDNKWVNNLAASLTKNLERDYANEVIAVILLRNKYPSNALAQELYNILGRNLTKRANIKPTPPKNWSRKVPETESYYQDELEEIRSFLESPSQQVFDYRRNERIRKAMASAIKSVTLDLRMETIRSGSPHTLRLIKTQSAYELALKHWEEDSDLLARLLALDNN